MCVRRGPLNWVIFQLLTWAIWLGFATIKDVNAMETSWNIWWSINLESEIDWLLIADSRELNSAYIWRQCADWTACIYDCIWFLVHCGGRCWWCHMINCCRHCSVYWRTLSVFAVVIINITAGVWNLPSKTRYVLCVTCLQCPYLLNIRICVWYEF